MKTLIYSLCILLGTAFVLADAQAACKISDCNKKYRDCKQYNNQQFSLTKNGTVVRGNDNYLDHKPKGSQHFCRILGHGFKYFCRETGSKQGVIKMVSGDSKARLGNRHQGHYLKKVICRGGKKQLTCPKGFSLKGNKCSRTVSPTSK